MEKDPGSNSIEINWNDPALAKEKSGAAAARGQIDVLLSKHRAEVAMGTAFDPMTNVMQEKFANERIIKESTEKRDRMADTKSELLGGRAFISMEAAQEAQAKQTAEIAALDKEITAAERAVELYGQIEEELASGDTVNAKTFFEVRMNQSKREQERLAKLLAEKQSEKIKSEGPGEQGAANPVVAKIESGLNKAKADYERAQDQLKYLGLYDQLPKPQKKKPSRT